MTGRANAKTKATLNSTPEIFRACCGARAYLYSIGEYDLHEAVDGLQEHAERHGLIDEIGQDAVQHLMSEAFRHARDPAGVAVARAVPQSTLEAADYLLTLNDAERLHEWLGARSAADVEGIFKHWRKGGRL
jgi:hypothetical protein